MAHIKSTDIDMQQDNLESQLKIYQTQLDQYNKLLQCVQDDTNYFSETNPEDQPTTISTRPTRARSLRRPLMPRPIRLPVTPMLRSRP